MNLEKVTKIGVILFIATFIAYGLFESYKLITGPRITIATPSGGEQFEMPLIDVKGATKNISLIELDDRRISVDKFGNFNEKLMLSPGYNIITIKAQDKFGKKIEKKIELFLKSENIYEIFFASTTEASESSTDDILEDSSDE